jgi:4-diphosphocytidyl-2C-methyl-D-erythritol kinase
MRLLAPAKINLHLRVGPRSADGYHPLLTWMCTAGLFDTLTFVRGARSPTADQADQARAAEQQHAPAEATPDWFSLSTDAAGLATDRRNLVTRAATALTNTLSRAGEGATDVETTPMAAAKPLPRVSVFLIKRIPAGSGLGGGSSDAATTLMALNAMWELNLPASRLSGIGATLGSDVPFFLHAPSAICTGRGEVVRPIAPPAIAKWAVLVLPDIEMPTPAVYRRFDEMNLGRADDLTYEPDWGAWTSLPAAELVARLVNDLEPPAFDLRPELGELRLALERKWVRTVRMSGSGSSLFTLCDAGKEAEDLAAIARTSFTNVRALAVQLAPPATISAAGAQGDESHR